MDRKRLIDNVNDVINDLREFDTYSGYQSMLNLLEENIRVLIESYESEHITKNF